MKTKINFICVLIPLVLLAIFSGCSGKAPDIEKVVANNTDSLLKDSIQKIKELKKFDTYSKIEIVSFKSEDWERFKNDAADTKGKLKFKPKKDQIYLDIIPIIDRVELTPAGDSALSTLGSLDNSKPCHESWDRAKCYSPRHAIIFYEGKKRTAYFEICFHCHQFRNYSPFSFCVTNVAVYKDFFKKIGITYFGEF